eukprot:TRINITY_DN75959_c0_g1_i1.p1 TRINITY_DN75959_c0_g1~~TRINITY_DN75959_c0_g1_i1.p1  ORF type:complete len:164 (+),score=56.20 TRINITY_DN75959_c0_g1_i1:40-492(+)
MALPMRPEILALGAAASAAGACLYLCCRESAPPVVEADEGEGIPVMSAEMSARHKLRPRYDALERMSREVAELQALPDMSGERYQREVELLLELVLKELERIDATQLTFPTTRPADLDAVRAVRKQLVKDFKSLEANLFTLKKRTHAELA